MSDLQTRIGQYDELLRRFASGVRAAQLYAPDHPLVGRNVEGLLAVLKVLHAAQPSVAIGIVGTQLIVADTPMSKASLGMAELVKRLKDHLIERMSFERGVTEQEIAPFILALAALGGKARSPPRRVAICAHPRRPHHRRTAPSTGSAPTWPPSAQLYSDAVSVAQVAWESAQTEGAPDRRPRSRRSTVSPRPSPRTAPRSWR